MLIKEYRIALPFSLAEYQRGQLFSVTEASKNETGGGEGVEVVKQEPFTSTELRPGETLTGTYTYKIYRLRSKMPWYLRKILPEAAMVLHEESWNAFPYCKTVVSNPSYMKKDFYIIIETVHVADDSGQEENALTLDKKQLKRREVITLDILDDANLLQKDLKPETDPAKVASTKAKRGPLEAGWASSGKYPVICAYKLCTVHFKWFGLQSKVEKSVHHNYPRLFTKFHREVYCWMDRWYDLTIADIRKLEAEAAEQEITTRPFQLRHQLRHGEKRGMSAASDED